jgi:acyl-CoA dehydrogenase
MEIAAQRLFSGTINLKSGKRLGILDAASYESLPLSLTMGINIALFLEPVSKHANESVKQGIFHRFLQEQNMGLCPIPYVKNVIDIEVPGEYKLQEESTGLKLMLDLLHRSRLQFPGMGMGFIRRMLDEAINHCSTRFVGGKPLIALDQIKLQISRIQSAFSVSSAMCMRSSQISGIENDPP